VEKVEVERKGSVRRAKLTYLRQRIGKSATLVKEKEGRTAIPKPTAAAAAPAPSAAPAEPAAPAAPAPSAASEPAPAPAK
jgi:hypothetical protein